MPFFEINEINTPMDKKSLIKQILLAFEQSSTKIKYSEIYKYNDGPNDKKQITVSFGITEYGNLKKLIKSYCFKGGKYTNDFISYTNDIGEKSLVNDDKFISLLKESAKDPIMQQAQEEAFDEMYIDPAFDFCNKHNLVFPLSKLVIADSYLHSGSVPSVVRNKFSATLPDNGGDEEIWINEYVIARREWLATHPRKLLHNTVYRMDFMIDRIKNGDWDLTQSPLIANDVKITF